MNDQDQDPLPPERPEPKRARFRRERETLPDCPDSKRPPAAATIIALAELELFTR